MHKPFFLLICLLGFSCFLSAQPAKNLILITLDGLRWQEVFGGLDSVLAQDDRFHQGNSHQLLERYGAPTAEERRAKLMPFLWSTIAQQGQIWGNRAFDNQVINANPYWFSYPGYSELLCGYVDTAINSNGFPPNPHINLLEFLHKQAEFDGRVAAFCAWHAFDRILNEERAGFPVVSGSDRCGGETPSPREQLLNEMKLSSYMPFGQGEQLDVFTHYAAMEHLKDHRPRVLYIGYGETDEWAHHSHYRDYLDAARQTDTWIQEIWEWVQADPEYRNQTALFITTDHGRGDQVKEEWTGHGQRIKDSNQIWFAAMGPALPARGELTRPARLEQRQFAQTLAEWLGLHFSADHPIDSGIWEELKQ